jgi:hypothetical protein
MPLNPDLAFGSQTGWDHLNTRLVRYSDVHCSWNKEGLVNLALGYPSIIFWGTFSYTQILEKFWPPSYLCHTKKCTCTLLLDHKYLKPCNLPLGVWQMSPPPHTHKLKGTARYHRNTQKCPIFRFILWQ